MFFTVAAVALRVDKSMATTGGIDAHTSELNKSKPTKAAKMGSNQVAAIGDSQLVSRSSVMRLTAAAPGCTSVPNEHGGPHGLTLSEALFRETVPSVSLMPMISESVLLERGRLNAMLPGPALQPGNLWGDTSPVSSSTSMNRCEPSTPVSQLVDPQATLTVAPAG